MKKVILLSVLLLGILLAQAASPNWSVNPSAYSYNMTVTAVLNQNCKELKNPSNKLGAFINGQLRGSVLTSVVANGHYIALLTVYSDNESADTVKFQIYNAETDQIVSTKSNVVFQSDAVYGTTSAPLEIVTNNAPTALTISTTSITENNVTGATVGNLSTVDLDAGDTHTYSLVTGEGDSDNSLFSILSNQLIVSGVLNYEVKKQYTIRLSVADNTGCAFQKSFIINVENTNDAPTNITLTNNRIDENLPNSSIIGLLTTSDEDVADSFEYQLIAGVDDTDNGLFALQGERLVTKGKLDFETKDTYFVRINTTDRSNQSFEKAFTIYLNDINDEPTGLTISNDSLAENNAVGATIGVFSAIDQDAGDTHTFKLKDIPGNNNDKFFIVGNQLKTSVVFDYEAVKEYYIYVSTFDSYQKEAYNLFTIKIINSNDAPTDLELSNSSVSENAPIGTFIGKLSCVDIDENQTHLYSLISGSGASGNSSFYISNDSLYTKVIFNRILEQEYSIRVQTDDQNGSVFFGSFTIFIKDVNNAPTDILLNRNQVNEDATIGTLIGEFSASDADPGDGHSFRLVSGLGGDDNTSFVISDDELKTNTTYDFQTKNEYKIRIEANDGFGGTFQKEFIVQITKANDAPSDIILTNNTLVENSPQGTLVGLLSSVDSDVSDTHTYSLVTSAGSDNNSFLVNGTQLLATGTFDFEVQKLYFVTVRSTDNQGNSLINNLLLAYQTRMMHQRTLM